MLPPLSAASRVIVGRTGGEFPVGSITSERFDSQAESSGVNVVLRTQPALYAESSGALSQQWARGVQGAATVESLSFPAPSQTESHGLHAFSATAPSFGPQFVSPSPVSEQDLLLLTLQQQERRLLLQQSQRHAAEDARGKASPQRRALLNELRAPFSPPPVLHSERNAPFFAAHSAPTGNGNIIGTGNGLTGTTATWIQQQEPQQQFACGVGVAESNPGGTTTSLLQSHFVPVASTSNFSKSPVAMAASDWSGRCRAVVVGCTYCLSSKYALWGPANDAYIFAHSLVHLLGLSPDEVLLMTDALPASCYAGRPVTRGGGGNANSNSANACPRKPVKGLVLHPPVDVENIAQPVPNPSVQTQPTRHNILMRCVLRFSALKWLVKDALPGDRLFFYFSGLSTQVDNLNAYEGEGYDEALLPSDFEALTSDDDPAVLLTTQIKEILLSVPPAVHLSMFLDTCGGQTILDPAGTGSVFSFIKGVKQKGFWPFLTNPTNRMQRATFNAKVWTDANMQAQRVRPRYMPGFAVSGVSASRCPLLSQSPGSLSNSNKAFLVAAAPWGQVAVEAAFVSLSLPARLSSVSGMKAFATGLASTQGGEPVVHGVFTWALVSALLSLFGPENKSNGRKVSYEQLLAALRDCVRDLKWNRLFELDQFPELTIHTGGAASFDSAFFVPGCPPSFSGSHASDPKVASAGVCCVVAEEAAASAASAFSSCEVAPAFLSAEDAWLSLTDSQVPSSSGISRGGRRWREVGILPLCTSVCSEGAQASVVDFAQETGRQFPNLNSYTIPPKELTAADCCRLLSERQASSAAESVNSWETFAPKRSSKDGSQHPPPEDSLQQQQPHVAWMDVCSSSGASEECAFSPQGTRPSGSQPQSFSVLYTAGSAVLMSPKKQAPQRLQLSPRQGGCHSAERPQYISEKEAAARRAEKQAADAAKREVYVQLAAQQVAQNASAEAASAAAANAAYLQQQIKLRDVAPQADALGEHVKEQQRTAMLLQELNPPPPVKQQNRGKPSKTPIYPATLIPIYEATRD